MSKKAIAPQTRRHIILFDEDWDWLTSYYGPGGHHSEVGVSKAVRTIIHQRVQGLKAKLNGAVDRLYDSQRPTGEDGVDLGDKK